MKQKLTAFLLCFVMVLSLCAVLPFGSLAEESSADIWDGSVAASFAGGKGTPGDPWQIGTITDLIDLRNYIADEAWAEIFVSASYVLVADIDFMDAANTDIQKDNRGNVTNWVPISTFSGSFDGNGHTISNLKITNGSSNQALFANASGVIENLTMKDCESSTSENGAIRAILVANTQGELTVQNCHIVNGEVSESVKNFKFVFPEGFKIALFKYHHVFVSVVFLDDTTEGFTP